MSVIPQMEPDDDQVSLPPLPSHCLDAELASSKRARSQNYDATTSSDPALFSSDERDPNAENYVSERTKHQWRGTWWGEKFNGRAPSNSNKRKRKFTRNLDSGVWMGSDGSESSLKEDLTEDCSASSTGLSTVRGGRSERVGDRFEANMSAARPASSGSDLISSRNAAVDEVIDACLETGKPTVDLLSMSLHQVPNDSLSRLRGLTKHSNMVDTGPYKDIYASIEPELQIYLSNNLLTKFPTAILDLTSLRLLSLRGNKLTRIPPTISRLPNLESLNVAGNRLNFLPFEILRLCQRPKFGLIAAPNPFGTWESQGLNGWVPPVLLHPDVTPHATTQGILMGWCDPVYFHINGSIVEDGILLELRNRVPSLFELALRTNPCVGDLADDPAWPDSEQDATPLSIPLSLARDAAEYGCRQCATCHKPFIVPRIQWTEWWLLTAKYDQGMWRNGLATGSGSFTGSDGTTIIPFRRQACSWACGVNKPQKPSSGVPSSPSSSPITVKISTTLDPDDYLSTPSGKGSLLPVL